MLSDSTSPPGIVVDLVWLTFGLKMMMMRAPGLFGGFFCHEFDMRKKAINASRNSVISTLSAVLFVILPCSGSSCIAVKMYSNLTIRRHTI